MLSTLANRAEIFKINEIYSHLRDGASHGSNPRGRNTHGDEGSTERCVRLDQSELRIQVLHTVRTSGYRDLPPVVSLVVSPVAAQSASQISLLA
jgi:hypothetical protein